MKRKIYSLLLIVILTVVVVAMPVIASSSPVTEESAPATDVSIGVTGTTVSVLESAVKVEVSNVVSNATHLTNLGVDTKATLVSSFDLTYSGTIPEGGVLIPITVKVGKVGDYAYVLHRRSSDGLWEKVGEGTLGTDLTVIATLKSFSPVAVMLVSEENVNSEETSPQTGQK